MPIDIIYHPSIDKSIIEIAKRRTKQDTAYERVMVQNFGADKIVEHSCYHSNEYPFERSIQKSKKAKRYAFIESVAKCDAATLPQKTLQKELFEGSIDKKDSCNHQKKYGKSLHASSF